MSAEACTLSIVELEELRGALDEQRDAIVRILSEADAAENGLLPNWDLVLQAVSRIATSIMTVGDTLDLRTKSEAVGEPMKLEGGAP